MKGIAFAGVAILAWFVSVPASAQLISDVNIFNTGTHEATVTMNTEYSDSTFPHQDAVDLSTAQVYFGDYLRSGVSYTTIDDQLMTLSGFTASSGIDSIRFYQGGYENGRVATQVTIYYSLSNTTSQSPTDFIALNGGNPYSLPLTSAEGSYLHSSASGFAYDTLTGLNIPTGAQSVLLDFGAERDAYGAPGTTYDVGAGFSEIQAFAPVPEPTTYAMMAMSALGLFGWLRLRRAT